MGRDKALSYSSNPELWLTSVSITLLCIALIVIIGYYLSDKNRSIFTKFLGVLFFTRFIFLHGYMTGLGHWDLTNSLPLHLCGISSLVIIFIMFKFNQSMYEYLVLLGIPSAIHSILTPQFINGWDGYYFPWIFNINDFEPITGSIHQPPPVHQTFQSKGFVICSFVSRLFDYHKDAIPSPYPHSNVDSDEVIFYSMGDFMSRKGIGTESITYHPMGLPHGPQPGKYEASIGKKKTDELAVMIDTFKPLNITENSLKIEDKNYYLSWL